MFAAQKVLADEQDVINFVAGVNWQHDSNIFRAPSGTNMNVVAGRSERWDEITTSYAGVRIDKLYSLQRFKFDFTQTAYRYRNYDFLNFDAKEYKAVWLWALTPYLTGNLSADRSQSLNSFQDYNNYRIRNIRTTENRRFDADWSPYGNWHLLAGLSESTSRNSETFNEEFSYSQLGLNAGIRYVFPSGSSFTVMGYERQGDYEKRELNTVTLSDTGFDERQADATLNWILSGKSRLNLRLGYVDREHDHFTRRDYAEPFGSASYIWAPTGKLQFSATASRDIASFQTSATSFTVNDTLAFSPTWLISSKLTLQGSASVSSRKFEGDGVIGALAPDREDTSRNVSVTLTWKPYRCLVIGGNMQHSSRDSTQSGLDFSDTSAGISAQLFI